MDTEATNRLTELAPVGTTVYTVLRTVSPSGMSRRISAYVIIDNEPRFLDGLIERAGYFKRRGDKEGLYLSGAGMDMGFHLVYSLSKRLHNDGYALNQKWI